MNSVTNKIRKEQRLLCSHSYQWSTYLTQTTLKTGRRIKELFFFQKVLKYNDLTFLRSVGSRGPTYHDAGQPDSTIIEQVSTATCSSTPALFLWLRIIVLLENNEDKMLSTGVLLS